MAVYSSLYHMTLKILSVNCQGLGSMEKRLDLFNYLKQKQCQIYCLQDTHTTKTSENFLDPSGIVNAFSAQAHRMPEVLLFFLVRILNMKYTTTSQTPKEIT